MKIHTINIGTVIKLLETWASTVANPVQSHGTSPVTTWVFVAYKNDYKYMCIGDVF